ncbi:MAG: hypothetical protein U0234_32815 [Sandaracinus sp.]
MLDARRTLAVSAVSKDEALRHTGFVAMKVKDAIVDHLRAKDPAGRRPDVDREDPDVGVFVHVSRGHARSMPTCPAARSTSAATAAASAMPH